VDFEALFGDVGRIRVGRYRVFVRNGNEVLAVLDVLSRQHAYGKKDMEKWK
jgi:mRNA-degrading endonuclease RelE of RelBE toxin-antitoxin system